MGSFLVFTVTDFGCVSHLSELVSIGQLLNMRKGVLLFFYRQEIEEHILMYTEYLDGETVLMAAQGTSLFTSVTVLILSISTGIWSPQGGHSERKKCCSCHLAELSITGSGFMRGKSLCVQGVSPLDSSWNCPFISVLRVLHVFSFWLCVSVWALRYLSLAF